MNSLLEACSIKMNDLRHTLDFKKFRDGSPLTVSGAKELQRGVAECAKDLIDAMKALRAFLPKATGVGEPAEKGK